MVSMPCCDIDDSQPDALDFRAGASEVPEVIGFPASESGGGAAGVGKNPDHSFSRMARYVFANSEAMVL